MREITLNKKEKITTPWLNKVQAAIYLGISKNDFDRKVADACPSKCFGRHRKYHTENLDKFNPQNAEEY